MHITLTDNAHVAHDADRQFTQFMVLAVGERLRRRNDDGFSCVNAQRVEVFHVADRNTVVETVADNFIFYFFPTFETLFHEHLGRERESLLGKFIEFFFVVAETRTQSTEGISRTNDDRISQSLCSASCIFNVVYGFTLDGFYINLVEFLDKEFAVFSVHDGLHGSAKHLEIIFFQHTTLVELNTAVECCLSTKCKHNTLWTFLLNHSLDEIGSDGKEVNLVSHAFRSLDSGDIWVDENSLDAFFFEGFQSLATRIVELSGLTNLECARTEEENFLNARINHDGII